MAAGDDLRSFAADLTAAGALLPKAVRPVVHRGAGKIQRQLNREMQASPHFRNTLKDGRIDYSMTTDEDGIEAQVGPRSGPGQSGALANIAYFGTSRGGGTVPDPKGALDAETPHFEKALADVVDGLLR